jgi:hypothetical protein
MHTDENDLRRQETKTLGIAKAVCGTENIGNKMPPRAAGLQM